MDSKFLFFSLFTSILILCSTGKDLKSIEHDFVNFPTTNPVATSPPTVITIPSGSNAPGQRWCVAKAGVPEKNLQAALDYACGIGKADCSGIQQGSGCYNPNTLQNHASFAFNSYYHRNPAPTSCDFGGTALLTTTNPSSGSCIFPTSSSSTTASPITTPPATPTPTPATPILSPTTASSSGAAPTGSSGVPPTILNGSNPGLGGVTTGFGDSPPGVNMTSSVSQSSSLLPFFGSILVVASIVTGGMVM